MKACCLPARMAALAWTLPLYAIAPRRLFNRHFPVISGPCPYNQALCQDVPWLCTANGCTPCQRMLHSKQKSVNSSFRGFCLSMGICSTTPQNLASALIASVAGTSLRSMSEIYCRSYMQGCVLHRCSFQSAGIPCSHAFCRQHLGNAQYLCLLTQSSALWANPRSKEALCRAPHAPANRRRVAGRCLRGGARQPA